MQYISHMLGEETHKVMSNKQSNLTNSILGEISIMHEKADMLTLKRNRRKITYNIAIGYSETLDNYYWYNTIKSYCSTEEYQCRTLITDNSNVKVYAELNAYAIKKGSEGELRPSKLFKEDMEKCAIRPILDTKFVIMLDIENQILYVVDPIDGEIIDSIGDVYECGNNEHIIGTEKIGKADLMKDKVYDYRRGFYKLAYEKQYISETGRALIKALNNTTVHY